MIKLPITLDVGTPYAVKIVEAIGNHRLLDTIDILEINYALTPRTHITIAEQPLATNPVIKHLKGSDALMIDRSMLSLIQTKCATTPLNIARAYKITLAPINDSVEHLPQHNDYFLRMGLDVSMIVQNVDDWTICSYSYYRYIVLFNNGVDLNVFYNPKQDRFELGIPNLLWGVREETDNLKGHDLLRIRL